MNVRWILLLFTVLLAVSSVDSGQCRKTRRVIECFWNCANNNINVNVSDCDCAPQNGTIAEQQQSNVQLQAVLSNEVPQATTVYRNSRKISITLEPKQHAFVYVFEFSPVILPNKWSYAGFSSSPTIEFTIPDPCMDYQFRVFALVPNSSNNNTLQLIAYRARAIPIDLPSFSLKPEQIRMEQIIYNRDNHTILVYINWKNPRGYTQADIFGYESPAVYPIQCLSPEDLLPTPIVETFAKGGRLRLTLPIEMLEEKCRLWFEVRMLPICMRIEPFTIQQTVELNCNNLQSIDICQQSVPPQCIDNVDIWGFDNEAVFMWQQPSNKHRPLYYSVRYGPVELQGTDPFLSWMITMETELKVDGDTTTVRIPVQANANYGAQICAVYDEGNSNIKFGLIKVIPFMCSSCSSDQKSSQTSKSCGECSRIENTNSFHRCSDVANKSCKAAARIPGISGFSAHSTNFSNQKFEESGDVPVTDELVTNTISGNNGSITNNNTGLTVAKVYNETGSIINGSKVVTKNKGLSTDIEQTIENILTSELKRTNEGNFEGLTTESDKELLSKLSSAITDNITNIEENALLHGIKIHVSDVTNASGVELTPTTAVTTNPLSSSPISTQRALLLIKNQTQGLPILNHHKDTQQSIVDSTVTAVSTALHSAETQNPSETNEFGPTKSREIRMHQKSFASPRDGGCVLDNGAYCQFGCATSAKCICPEPEYTLTMSGSCQFNGKSVENSNFSCIYVSDINGTWDSQMMLLNIYSSQLYNTVKGNKLMDRVYLEFATVQSNESKFDEKLDGKAKELSFADSKRYKVVVETEKILQQKFFIEKPFPFYLNHDIEPLAMHYGLKICEYNSAKVPLPYSVNWEGLLNTELNGRSSTKIQISPVNFVTANAAPMSTTNMTRFFITIPFLLIIVLLLLIFFIIFFDCTKLRHICGRRKTKYYQTYIVNSRNPYKNRGKLTTHNGFMISTARY